VPADDLAARIDELRRHLDAGELAGLPPIDLGSALTLSHVEQAVRRMLQDVEMFRAMDPAPPIGRRG
jgi:HAMP domain-containing protein